MKIIFLGTAGGRFSTINQKRMSGGFRIDNLGGKNYHVDPGPGALVRSYQFALNPKNIDGVIVSHAHTDHYSDAEIMIESMTYGMTRETGVIVGSQSVLEGYEDWGPCVSSYHKSKSRNIILEEGKKKYLNRNVSIKGCRVVHGDPVGMGFQLEDNDFKISYTSDTSYFDELKDFHEGSDIVIASVLRPGTKSIKGHMCASDFAQLLKEVKPKIGIMTHFGIKMLSSNPVMQVKEISAESGVKTLAAFDGMSLEFNPNYIAKPRITSLRDENNKLFKVERKAVTTSPFKTNHDRKIDNNSFKKDFTI